MRQELGGGFGRHQNVAIHIGEILEAGIRTSRRIFMVQLERADGNRVIAGLCQNESSDVRERADCLEWHSDQSIITNRIPCRAVVRLILAESCTEQCHTAPGCSPRVEPGGCGRDSSPEGVAIEAVTITRFRYCR